MLLALGIALLGWVVYINSLTNPFVYDDYRLIVENTALAHPDRLGAVIWHDVTRPVVNLSFALDAALWGIRPLGFHVTNVAVHVINVLLVFAFAWCAARDRSAQSAVVSRVPEAGDTAAAGTADVVAAVTASLFAVHPMLTQAVGYVSARSELLCATFVLAALLAARRFLLGHGWPWAAATFVLWLIGLGSKEVAAVLPLALVAYDAFVLRTPWRRSAILHVPMLAFLGLAGAARVWILLTIEYSQTPFDWRLALVGIDAIRRYLQLLVWPSGQTIFHSLTTIEGFQDARLLVTAVVLAGAGTAAWRLRHVDRLIPFGLFWFLLFLLPSTALFTLGRGEALAEHRVYLASAGAFLTAAALCGALLQRVKDDAPAVRWVAIAGVAIVLLQLGGRTIVRNAVWADNVGLWQESVAKAPDHWLPRMMLAEALRVQKGCAAAERDYRLAISLRPDETFSYVKLGGCLVEQQRFDEAVTVFSALREVAPRSAEGPTGLAIVAMLHDGPDASRTHLLDALRRDPLAILPRQLLATLEEPRDPAAALRLCREIQQLAPGTPGADDCVHRNQRRVGATSVTP